MSKNNSSGQKPKKEEIKYMMSMSEHENSHAKWLQEVTSKQQKTNNIPNTPQVTQPTTPTFNTKTKTMKKPGTKKLSRSLGRSSENSNV
jgi:hypothetical protein